MKLKNTVLKYLYYDFLILLCILQTYLFPNSNLQAQIYEREYTNRNFIKRISSNSKSNELSFPEFVNSTLNSLTYKLNICVSDIKNSQAGNPLPENYASGAKDFNRNTTWLGLFGFPIAINYQLVEIFCICTLAMLLVIILIFMVFNKLYGFKKDNKSAGISNPDESENLEKTNLHLQNEILERIKAEESLKYSEEHYRLIVENSIDAIIIFQDENIVYTNPKTKQILDYDFCDTSLDSFLKYIHPEDRETVRSNYLRSNADEYAKNYYSVRIKRKDREEIIIEINSVKLPQKEKYEIIFFIKDITNRIRAEDEIKNALEREKELSELRSRFISMTSHEFRTPLTSVNTSVEILEKFSEHLTDEQKKNNFIRIQENINQMKRLLNDILIIGKSDAGMLKLNMEPVDINKLCSNIINHFQTYILYCTKLKFKYDTDSSNNIVLLDGGLIKNMIENIISNAIKYSSNGKTIFFKMNFTNSFIIFKIKDEGIGIPENELRSLFEPFYRASNTGNIPGSGLGLAIVKRAVELHNGKININSKINEGTEFTITIPLIKAT
jgi:PAS domain S-box-containing protein